MSSSETSCAPASSMKTASLRAGDDEVEVGVLGLIEGRVDDELAGLDVAADAHAGERALERDAGGHAAPPRRP